MTIICSGSLAFDRLALYQGKFSDLIIADKIKQLNVCFLVEKVERVHGGTAGNICYNLQLLGEKPLVVATVGDDPDGSDYVSRLEAWGLDTTHVKVAPGEATAGAYIATDETGNQLLFFNPGAMGAENPFDPKSLPGNHSEHLAIVSPGGFADMERLAARYRELGIKYVFDPGQQIPVFTGKQLTDMLDGSLLLITNEYEFELFMQKTGLNEEKLFQYTTAVVTTLGAKGSKLTTPRGAQHVMPVPTVELGNPTGAGDAYRAGLLASLAHGEDILSACRLGSSVASFCVEAEGTQKHFFTPSQLLPRHFRTFKVSPLFLG